MDMPTNRWWTYVEKTMDGDSALEAGRKAGFDSSAFTRWKKGGGVDVYFVVKFARAYGQNVIQALAEAEFITDEEAGIRQVTVGVQDISDGELIAEVARRLEQR
ncbi:hypothetical protein [Humibacter sp.]|uniref:hypothetical protein n=1 Tax=Humibacter sp. TaxID=1940291 RepID=UPI003F822E63